MNYGIMEALNQITRERRVDKALLFETLEAGLTQAIKKKYGNNAVVQVEIDEEAGVLHPFLVKTVVVDEDEIEDPVCQITLEEAHDTDPKLKIGDEVREELKFAEFGRNAIALAKQVLVQRVREVERGKIFDEYKARVGEVITGTVQQQDRTGVLVTLGKAEAFLPKKESIRRERWHQGLPIKAYVLEVLDVTKGPQVILSRTHPGLIEKLFEAEVPEIYDDIVEIKSVARDAGGRSKIAVYSKDERVDAVGACVGMKGSRVQAVVKELSGERVDIVPWSEEAQQFVTKALSPAKVQSMRVDRDRQEMTVVVDDEQLSLAIGPRRPERAARRQADRLEDRSRQLFRDGAARASRQGDARRARRCRGLRSRGRRGAQWRRLHTLKDLLGADETCWCGQGSRRRPGGARPGAGIATQSGDSGGLRREACRRVASVRRGDVRPRRRRRGRRADASRDPDVPRRVGARGRGEEASDAATATLEADDAEDVAAAETGEEAASPEAGDAAPTDEEPA
jgi:N utilization substance protein A